MNREAKRRALQQLLREYMDNPEGMHPADMEVMRQGIREDTEADEGPRVSEPFDEENEPAGKGEIIFMGRPDQRRLGTGSEDEGLARDQMDQARYNASLGQGSRPPGADRYPVSQANLERQFTASMDRVRKAKSAPPAVSVSLGKVTAVPKQPDVKMTLGKVRAVPEVSMTLGPVSEVAAKRKLLQDPRSLVKRMTGAIDAEGLETPRMPDEEDED